MTTRAAHPKANRLVRILGGFLLTLAGANLLLLPRFGWSEASIMVVGGLFMLLFTPEATNDERVQSLKLKAISWGYAAGALGTLVYEVMRRSISYGGWPELTPYDSLIAVTALALCLFRYWRWMDGRLGE